LSRKSQCGALQENYKVQAVQQPTTDRYHHKPAAGSVLEGDAQWQTKNLRNALTYHAFVLHPQASDIAAIFARMRGRMKLRSVVIAVTRFARSEPALQLRSEC
jgi:hypothetical protein